MQLLATADQMRKLDATAIGKFGIPGLVLMENAGRAFVDALEHHRGTLQDVTVLILCGKGNNGGDGFVIARHLANRGARVYVGVLARKRAVAGDAKTQLAILLKTIAARKVSIVLDEITSRKRLPKLPHADIIVDAMFGTGFTGAVKGVQKDVMEWMNKQSAYVAAVDMPSGVDASTGRVENVAIKADLTVAMGLAKVGHFVGAGRDHAGIVDVVDISIPAFLFVPAKQQTYRVTAKDVRTCLPRRPRNAHKYSVGTVLVVAGSRSFTGAPVMTALSAMRAGAGAVILAVPKSIHQTIARKVTEVMLLPLEETEEGTLAPAAEDMILEKLPWADVVALGPGIGQHPDTRRLVYSLLSAVDKPMVVDADALGALAYNIDALKKRLFPTIVTPHVGEFRLMSKLPRNDIDPHRVPITREWAKKFNCTLLLKGAPTVTGTPDGNVFLNATGNPGMATAGSGDVLTGIVASFRAQGMTDGEAAYCGAFVHGAAGDIAAQAFGERSLMALDIMQNIPDALNGIENA